MKNNIFVIVIIRPVNQSTLNSESPFPSGPFLGSRHRPVALPPLLVLQHGPSQGPPIQAKVEQG